MVVSKKRVQVLPKFVFEKKFAFINIALEHNQPTSITKFV
jgi:hypothetical protein